jgi:hypothetical protein
MLYKEEKKNQKLKSFALLRCWLFYELLYSSTVQVLQSGFLLLFPQNTTIGLMLALDLQLGELLAEGRVRLEKLGNVFGQNLSRAVGALVVLQLEST